MYSDADTEPNVQSKYREKREDEEQGRQQESRYTESRYPENRHQEYRRPKYVEKGEREEENDGSQHERQQDRKPYRNHRQGRSEYASRNEYASRDEAAIHYYTELPHVPEHRKKKPSLEDHLERVRRIDDKKDQLKELRVQCCKIMVRVFYLGFLHRLLQI